MTRVSANAVANVVGTGLAYGLAVAASIAVARILGPRSYGDYSLVLWVVGLVAAVGDLGFTYGITNFGARAGELEDPSEPNYSGILALLLVLQIGLALALGAALVFFRSFIAEVLGHPEATGLVALAAFMLVPLLIAQAFRAVLAAEQRFDRINIVATLTSITSGVAMIGAAAAGGVYAVILVGVAANVAQGAAFVWLAKQRHVLRRLRMLNRGLATTALKFCLGVALLTTIDAVVWQRSETFFLSRYSTLDQIAFYGLASGLASLAKLIPSAITGVLLPVFAGLDAARDSDQTQRLYQTATRATAVCALPISAGGVAVAPSLVAVFYGASYRPLVPALQILLVASAVGAVISPTAPLFLSLGRPHLAVIWGVPIALLNIGLAILLIPHFGARGAAVANLVAQLAFSVALFGYLRRAGGIRFPSKQVAQILAASIPGAALAAVITASGTGAFQLLIAVFVGAIVYGVLFVKFKLVSTAEAGIALRVSAMLPGRVGQRVQTVVINRFPCPQPDESMAGYTLGAVGNRE